MKVNREDLIRQLSIVQRGVNPKEVIEQSDCFVFRETEEGPEVTAFNDEIACYCPTDLDIEGAVRAKPLMDLLIKMKAEELDISQSEGEILIRKGTERAGLTLEKEVKLEIDSVPQADKWQGLPDGFVDALSMAEACASTDESKQSLTCVHLHPKYVEACDNYQLIRCDIKTKLPEAVLIRRASVQAILDIEPTEVGLSKSWIHFRNDADIQVACRKYVDDYFDFNPFLKLGKSTAVTLPESIVEAAEKANVFSALNLKDSQVRIELGKGKVRVLGRSHEGWYRGVKKTDYEGEPFSFLISAKLLEEVVKRDTRCKIGESKLRIDGNGFVYISALGVVKDDE